MAAATEERPSQGSTPLKEEAAASTIEHETLTDMQQQQQQQVTAHRKETHKVQHQQRSSSEAALRTKQELDTRIHVTSGKAPCMAEARQCLEQILLCPSRSAVLQLHN